jgi:hypothetical protein
MVHMLRAVVVVALLAFTTPASATVIFNDTFSPQQSGWSFASPSAGFLGELNNNVNVASVTLTLAASADPTADLQFDLLMFRSMDGVNCCTDTFSLTINGSTVFSAALRDGGGGSTSVFIDTNGTTFTPNGSFTVYSFLVPHAIVSGANTYTFGYSPLQSLADEAWGLDNVMISADVAVPAPAALALMLSGLVLGGLGARLRTRV